MMSAPTVMIEKLPSAESVGEAVTALARYHGRKPTHIACIEAGDVNSTVSFVAAAEFGLSIIDGDGMGRAFPEVQMVLPTLAGIAVTPMSLVDEKGNRGVFDTIDNHWAERLERIAAVDMGCSTSVSLYAMTGAEVRGGFARGTLSKCIDLGHDIERARRENRDPVAAVAARLGGKLIHLGKVVDIQRKTETGFARCEATVEGDDDCTGTELVLHFQNEHLIVEIDGLPVTTTPDLIIVLDRETGEPFTTEGLRYGHRVSVIMAPADERWPSPAGIELVGPRYFGHETDPSASTGALGVPRELDT